MHIDAAEAAADILYGHLHAGTRFEELPADVRPATRADGYQIQSYLEQRSEAPLFGWKIAATSLAGQEHIGVDGPLAGRLLAEQVLGDGESCALGTSLMRVAELEFAFRMGEDLPPRADAYSVDEVLAAVATLHPAIEVPDSRYEQFERVGAPQLIADNACAWRFLLGPACVTDWRTLDLAAFSVRGRRNDDPAIEGSGANVLGDPRIALTWLANELSTLAIPLRAGQVITTGTCVPPLEISPGDKVRGDFGSLGQVSLTFA